MPLGSPGVVMPTPPSSGKPCPEGNEIGPEGAQQSAASRRPRELSRSLPPVTAPPPDEQRGLRTVLAARIDSAIEARSLAGQSHVCARIRSLPNDDKNPDSPGDRSEERRVG